MNKPIYECIYRWQEEEEKCGQCCDRWCILSLLVLELRQRLWGGGEREAYLVRGTHDAMCVGRRQAS